MPLTRKGARKTPLTLTNDLPEKAMADLPRVVLERFPELKDWQERNHQIWTDLRQVHQRHLEEITAAVNDAIEATKPKEGS